MLLLARGADVDFLRDRFVRALLDRLGVNSAVDVPVPGGAVGVIAIPKVPGMTRESVRRIAEDVLAEVRGRSP